MELQEKGEQLFVFANVLALPSVLWEAGLERSQWWPVRPGPAIYFMITSHIPLYIGSTVRGRKRVLEHEKWGEIAGLPWVGPVMVHVAGFADDRVEISGIRVLERCLSARYKPLLNDRRDRARTFTTGRRQWHKFCRLVSDDPYRPYWQLTSPP